MKRIGAAADMRLRTDGDLLRLAALPADPVYSAKRAACVMPRHAALLLETLNQDAVATTQHAHAARVVTSADSVRAALGAQAHDWYTMGKETDLPEEHALALQNAITVLNASYTAWGAAVFAARTERWQAQTPDGDERRAATATEVAARRAGLDAAIKAANEALAPAPELVASFDGYWAAIVEAILLRAEGIASASGTPLRAWNVRVVHMGELAHELGAQIDAGKVATA